MMTLQLVQRLFLPEIGRLENLQAIAKREQLDRARGKFTSTPGGAVRLCVDCDDLVFGLQQRL